MKEAEQNSTKVSINKSQLSLLGKSLIYDGNYSTSIARPPAATSSPLSTQDSVNHKEEVVQLQNELKQANKKIKDFETSLLEHEKIKITPTEDRNKSTQDLIKNIPQDILSSEVKQNIASTIRNRTAVSTSILNNHWLTDDLIQFYFNVLSAKVTKKEIYLMEPIVSQALKCLYDTDHCINQEMLQSNYIIVPVNDSAAVDIPGGSGSHWSLLLFSREQKRFFYFDSMKLFNYEHAKQIASALSNKLTGNKITDCTVVSVPQQTNGTDCWIYMLIFVETIVQVLLDGVQEPSWENTIPDITENIVLAKRAQLAMMYSNTQLNLGGKSILSMMQQPKKLPEIQNTAKLNKHSTNLVKEQWQEVKRLKGGKHSLSNEKEFSIQTSNRFTLLLNSNKTQNLQGQRKDQDEQV
ncbi:SUMO1 sentrin specific peptidase 8 [Homalodisca vitripennis]|nr:SUMO1 sentrin specific peptidase 8 [Homalodisca vitripennis]